MRTITRYERVIGQAAQTGLLKAKAMEYKVLSRFHTFKKVSQSQLNQLMSYNTALIDVHHINAVAEAGSAYEVLVERALLSNDEMADKWRSYPIQ